MIAGLGIKHAIGGAVILAIIGSNVWYGKERYKAGFDAATVTQAQAIAEAKDEAVAKAREQWEATAALAEDNIVIEERIVEVIREVEKEIPVVVERIVTETPECSDLGSDFAGLLNDQVRAGSGTSRGGTDAPAQPDG